MTDREAVTEVEDYKIPEGFKVTFHTLTGFNSVDRWFTARLPDGKKIEFGDRDAAINACIEHAKRKAEAQPKPGSLEDYWKDINPNRSHCVTCNASVNEDGSKVTWICAICGHRVCQRCTKTIGDIGREYHEQTFCSQKCWEAAGRPSE